MTIKEIRQKYWNKTDALDLELLIAREIKKSREFVLAHPEYKMPGFKIKNLKLRIARRRRGEPLAYILGQKEFFGLNLKVNKAVLIPRPETELLVEEALKIQPQNSTIIDVGTGSGNIIICLAKNLKNKNKFIAIDFSAIALDVARQNAKLHTVSKKINFLQGNLLEPIIKNPGNLMPERKYIIVANLPYLSVSIYNQSAPTVKNYEPKPALLSPRAGLNHYKKLLKQIKILASICNSPVTTLLEFSPEQKMRIDKLIKKYFPKSKAVFFKDLAGKWRFLRVNL